VKILVTGFKPFLGEKINPSEFIVNHIQENYSEFCVLVLPVEFKTAFEILKTQIKNQKPDYVIMLGQASGRKNISFEKIGLNWIQSLHSDESGYVPAAGAIQNDQPLALMTKFPVDQIYQKLKLNNQPVEISFSAGTYVCNELYFKVLSEFSELKAVFIHVPLLPEQIVAGDEKPSMELLKMVEVVESVLKLLI
jgi:pyroglutamyl-peptidase